MISFWILAVPPKLCRIGDVIARPPQATPVQAADVRGVAAPRRASPACWPGAGTWCLSASDTTARATAMAAYWPGAWTVTTLMIWSAVYALTMLADLRQAARPAAAAKRTGSGSQPSSRATVMVTLYRVGGSCMPGTISPVSDIYGLGIFWGSSESHAAYGLVQPLRSWQTAVSAAVTVPATERSSCSVS
jgi:hypothetical protein